LPSSNVSEELRALVDPDPGTSSSVFTPLPPPSAPRRPDKCYDMRSLRSQVTALHSELKSRAKSMEVRVASLGALLSPPSSRPRLTFGDC
jgi:hypothetical protein